MHLRLALLRHARERAHRLGAEVAAVGLGGPLGREVLGDAAGKPLLARDGLAGDLAARLPLDDGGLHVVDAHAGKRRVLGAQAHGVAPERLGRCGALGHGERAGEVVRGVEQRHRPLVVDALYHAAGHLLVGGVVLGEQRVGGLAPVPGDHLPRAVADLAHERQVGEAVLAYGLGELGYPRWVHGVGGVRRVVGDVGHRYLGHRVAPAGARRAVEKPRDGEARGHLARRAHGTPRRRELRSRVRGGSPARRPPPASIASCPRRPCCSRG